ncbi:MAG: WYL domain-containing protein [Gammaproteobacteria bacterium]|nr:WYL domain-containing protein [Gammaproteobacteria bacterium]
MPKLFCKVALGDQAMLPNAVQILSAAIANKRCVQIYYKGQTRARVIEPHVLFRSKSGRYVVESFQIRGYSSNKRQPPFWRPFQLKKIVNMRVMPELFNLREREGFSTIRKMVSGEVLSAAEEGIEDYFYFSPEVCGPPKPTSWGESTYRLQG